MTHSRSVLLLKAHTVPTAYKYLISTDHKNPFNTQYIFQCCKEPQAF